MNLESCNIYNIEYRSNEWFEFRKNHLGASEAGAVYGLSKFETGLQVWERKVGNTTSETPKTDLMLYGSNAEEHLTNLFILDFPQYEFFTTKDKVYTSQKHPFMSVSPDGLIKDRLTGDLGLYECKTATDKGLTTIKEWQGQIPYNYYIQILHTFLIIQELKFCVIKVQIKYVTENGENCFCETIHRKIYRKDCEEDLKLLENVEVEFWDKVEKKERPSVRICLV